MKKNGFTLIELLIVISLVMMLSAIAIPIYGNWHVSSEMDEDTAKIVGALRLAREQTDAGRDDAFFGVNFGPNRFSLVEVSAENGTSTVREEILPDALTITTDLAGNEVYFVKGSGLPDRSGTINLLWEGQSRAVSLNPLGLAEREQ